MKKVYAHSNIPKGKSLKKLILENYWTPQGVPYSTVTVDFVNGIDLLAYTRMTLKEKPT